MIDPKKVASLARIELNAAEEAQLVDQFPAMLEYFEHLKEVDTEGVEPMVTPIEVAQHLRVDRAVVWAGVEKALDQAPEKSGQLFQVPPVV